MKLLGIKSGLETGQQALRSSGIRIGWGATYKGRILDPPLNQGLCFYTTLEFEVLATQTSQNRNFLNHS